VAIYGAKGLAYIKVNDVTKGREGLQSPIVKNIHDAALAAVLARTGAVSMRARDTIVLGSGGSVDGAIGVSLAVADRADAVAFEARAVREDQEGGRGLLLPAGHGGAPRLQVVSVEGSP
jgi:hypothetical protein